MLCDLYICYSFLIYNISIPSFFITDHIYQYSYVHGEGVQPSTYQIGWQLMYFVRVRQWNYKNNIFLVFFSCKFRSIHNNNKPLSRGIIVISLCWIYFKVLFLLCFACLVFQILAPLFSNSISKLDIFKLMLKIYLITSMFIGEVRILSMKVRDNAKYLSCNNPF